MIDKIPVRLKGQPWIQEAALAHRLGAVRYEGKTAVLRIDGNEYVVPPSLQYDLTQATIFGLNERLTLSARGVSGRTLREEFNSEWETYSQALTNQEKSGLLDYGYYAYYWGRNQLARFCPPYWHRVVSVASNSSLLMDPKGEKSWQEIRDIFFNTTVAVAGCSVGSSVIHSIMMDVRPENIKAADKSVYKMENINRVRLSYMEMVKPNSECPNNLELPLKNKAQVVAEQIYAMDPYVKVFVYDEGITADNAAAFFGGDALEPAANIVVEEVDDPRVKLFIREEARRRQLPVVMVTDIGSAVQLDILRYDQDDGLPLTWGVSDDELYSKMEAVYAKPGNRQSFFNFVDALIGTAYRQDELKSIIEERIEIPTSTLIPQLGSTVAMAGAVAAEAVARLRLGYNYPPRAIINKRTITAQVFS